MEVLFLFESARIHADKACHSRGGQMTRRRALVHLSSAEGILKLFHRVIFVLKAKWKETMRVQQDV